MQKAPIECEIENPELAKAVDARSTILYYNAEIREAFLNSSRAEFAHENGIPYDEYTYAPEENFDPYAYDPNRMSKEDYDRMHDLIDAEQTPTLRKSSEISPEFLPSENPKSVDELQVGDYVRYDGNVWIITEIGGDFSIDFENADKDSIQSVSSIFGHWKEHLTKDGGEYLVAVPKIVEQQLTSENVTMERSDDFPEISRNFTITDESTIEGGAKAKFRANVNAIKTLKSIESEGRTATPDEQKILAQYVGWGGISQVFDSENSAWTKGFSKLKELLTDEEYTAARSSTLNAHYTSTTVINVIYKAVGNMGFKSGNVLIGNFFGCIPDKMSDSKLFGMELDSITGRIAQQLYPNAEIQINGFESTDFPDNFFDLAVGNVPFGNYSVADKRYDKEHFLIHDYFFAKTLDKVASGGIVAFVTVQRNA
ncbi:MAG: hypothetical protein K2N06_11725 [Oscillospiraceae bacterium]|nr:hypothetical protein [Oscillospiraceae bacterium]